MADFTGPERAVLRKLSDKGPLPYNVVGGGEAFRSLMTRRLIDWDSDERDTYGWRRVKITDAGRAALKEPEP